MEVHSAESMPFHDGNLYHLLDRRRIDIKQVFAPFVPPLRALFLDSRHIVVLDGFWASGVFQIVFYSHDMMIEFLVDVSRCYCN